MFFFFFFFPYIFWTNSMKFGRNSLYKIFFFYFNLFYFLDFIIIYEVLALIFTITLILKKRKKRAILCKNTKWKLMLKNYTKRRKSLKKSNICFLSFVYFFLPLSFTFHWLYIIFLKHTFRMWILNVMFFKELIKIFTILTLFIVNKFEISFSLKASKGGEEKEIMYKLYLFEDVSIIV